MIQETIHWDTNKTSFPEQRKYVLIASGLRIGVGYYDKSWYWEDAGGVEQEVDAWSPLPRGPYAEPRDSVDSAN